MKLNTGPELVDVDGMLVEKDCLRIAEAVHAYDENLMLLALDPARAEGVSDAPYVLMEKCRDGELRRIKNYWHLDDRILADIEAADGNRHNLVAVINGRQQEIKREKERRYKELRDEQIEVVKSIAGMKSSYTWNDPSTGEKVKFYDDRPAERGEAIAKKRQF